MNRRAGCRAFDNRAVFPRWELMVLGIYGGGAGLRDSVTV
jgi:hypothetical protein